jgi:hypothetical protein
MEVLASRIHLVEIDLVWAREPMPIMGHSGASGYSRLVSRGTTGPTPPYMPLACASRFPRSLCR